MSHTSYLQETSAHTAHRPAYLERLFFTRSINMSDDATIRGGSMEKIPAPGKENVFDGRTDSAISISAASEGNNTEMIYDDHLKTKENDNIVQSDSGFSRGYWSSRVPTPASLNDSSRAASPNDTKIFPSTSQTLQSMSRSLPTSRRNSADLTSFWSALDSLSLSSRPPADMRKKEEENQKSHGLVSHNTTESDFSRIHHAPPQFNDSFMFENEKDLPMGLNHQLGQDIFQLSGMDDNFPYLLRKSDPFTGMLSARSAALDLASLPQTSPRSARVSEMNMMYGGQKFGDRFQRQVSPPDFSNPLPSSSINSGASRVHSVDVGFRSNDAPQSYRPTSHSLSNSPFPELEGRRDVYTNPNSPTFTSNDLPLTPPIIGGSPTLSNQYNICRYYQQGFCSRGDRCSFVHSVVPSTTAKTVPLHQQISGINPNVYPSINPSGFNGSAAHVPNLLNPQYNTGNNFAFAGAGSTLHKILPPGMPAQKVKRTTSEEVVNRFAGIPFEELLGQLYSLCKDQHGCRYLQKKLEERIDSQMNAIFTEIFPHFAELMTDPFGNYLCQRIMEYCTDEQRTAIAEAVAGDLVKISLNMHGTRAVQKMIEYLSNIQQVRALIMALNMNVVTLIKDLNGNHVIQKCLHRLTCDQNQFIYNAVTENCVEVATHRHGCCVLQRCIDHASDSQRTQLVAEITVHALPLVQDPFGNYVVQYVLDLADGIYADAVIRRFIGHVCILSVQKFSSNVIEKCIRVATVETRKFLVEELLNKDRLEKLIKDSFANYVVQTALDFSDPSQRNKLIECIKPLLGHIRHTPYGKRIYNKINREQYGLAGTSSIPVVSNMMGFLHMPSVPPHLVASAGPAYPIPQYPSY